MNGSHYYRGGSSVKPRPIDLRLDPNTVDLTKPGVNKRFYNWPLAWTRKYGRGKIFYTALGHEQAVWQDPRFQELLLNGIKWSMGEMKE